jgi:O-antigen/teichoic acid export membrane protein
MPLMIVNSVVPPLIVEMYAQGKIIKLEKALRTIATMAGVPSFIVLSLFVLFGDSILGAIFGDYYHLGGSVLAILSIGQLANVWTGSCGMALMLTGNQLTMMMITIICGLFTVVSGWWLVLDYGSIGVAVATAAGMLLQSLLMLFYAKKRVGVWTHVSPFLLKQVRSIM